MALVIVDRELAPCHQEFLPALTRKRIASSLELLELHQTPHIQARACCFLLLIWLYAGILAQVRFVTWLQQMLLSSLYPGAPFQRKFMALSLLNILLQTQTSNPSTAVLWASEAHAAAMLQKGVTADGSQDTQSQTNMASVLLGARLAAI